MIQTIDPKQPPPFPIGAPIGQKPNSSTPPPKRNGTEPADGLNKYPHDGGKVDTAPLPEHRQKMWEAGNAAYLSVLAERDDYERKLHAANLKIEAMTVQLESLKGVVGMMESSYLQTKMEAENRISTYQSQRDEAVSRFASLEATLGNILVMCRNTIIEPPPQGESDG